MPLFTAAAIAITGAVAGSFIVTATAFALQVVAGIGLSLIARSIAGQKKPEPVGIQGKLTAGGDVPRSLLLGQYNTAGSLVYRGTGGQAGDTPNCYYFEVRALADMPSKGLSEVWCDGEKLSLVSPISSFSAPWVASSGHRKHGSDHLWFRFYDGTQLAADPVMVSYFGSSPRPYGPDRVGKGITYVIIVALLDDEEKENPLFTGFPQCKFTVDGLKLYDPSKDSTAGGVGAQRWDNPATWGGDGDYLPAVQAYNILRGITYNGQWLYGLQNANPAILPAANWIAAINKCRVLADGPNGPEPQYRAAAQINLDTPPADALEALSKACAGRISEVGGVYRMHVGEPDAPVLSFTDDDIISTEEQVYTPFHSLADSVNGVQAKYPEPLEGWNVKTSPAITDDDAEERDGNRRLMADVDLATVPYTGQVQRLLLSALREARRERAHTLTLPPWAQQLEPGDVVEWSSERNGYEQKWFRVEGLTYKANLDVLVQLIEVDPADYDWDQESDYQPPVFAPMEILRPAPQPIVAWYAEGQIVYDAQGLPRRPVIYLSWDGAKQNLRGVAYEISTTDDDSGVFLRDSTDDVAAGSIIVGSQVYIPGRRYWARGRYIPDSPRDTPFSAWLPADLPDVRYGVIDFDAAVQKQVTEILDERFQDVWRAIARNAERTGQGLSRTAIDKREVRTQLQARSDYALAEISRVEQVAVTAEEAVAQLEETVGAEFGPVKAQVILNTNAIATLDDYAAAQWSVLTDVNGNVAGLVLFNEGASKTSFDVIADAFRVCWPGVTGGDPVPVYTVANVGGVAKLALRGDMLIDGAILARMISAGQIQAVHIAAQSIGTNQLAIGGVDILNIIDGAAGYKLEWPISASSATSGDLVNVNFPVVSGDLLITWNGSVLIPTPGSGDPYTVDATLYVNGSSVRAWQWSSNAPGQPSERANFSLAWGVKSIPVGSRSIRINVFAWGSVTWGAGQLTVIERRR